MHILKADIFSGGGQTIFGLVLKNDFSMDVVIRAGRSFHFMLIDGCNHTCRYIMEGIGNKNLSDDPLINFFLI